MGYLELFDGLVEGLDFLAFFLGFVFEGLDLLFEIYFLGCQLVYLLVEIVFDSGKLLFGVLVLVLLLLSFVLD